MQKTHIHKLSLSAVLLALLAITGCSKENTDNPVNSSPPLGGYLTVQYDGAVEKVYFSNCASFDADGVNAVLLNEFIAAELIPAFIDKDENEWDSRKLYSYELLAEDGYSPSRTKGYNNLIWEYMGLGHILTGTRQVVFPDDKIDLPGAFNVKAASDIFVYRKIDVETPDTSDFLELRDMITTKAANWDGLEEDAIPLSEFISPLVTDPANYTYVLVSLDQYSPPADLTWEQLQTGYWLLDSKRTIFTNPDVATSKYRVQVLEKILVNQ